MERLGRNKCNFHLSEIEGGGNKDRKNQPGCYWNLIIIHKWQLAWFKLSQKGFMDKRGSEELGWNAEKNLVCLYLRGG